MKRIKILFALAAVVLSFAGAILAYESYRPMDELTKMNLEALSSGELGAGEEDGAFPKYKKVWKACQVFTIIEYDINGKVVSVKLSEYADVKAEVSGHYVKVVGPEEGQKSYCMDGEQIYCFPNSCY